MAETTPGRASKLIRSLREEAGLTQGELAARVGTTQSVISRLEGDDYEGHSLSMLYRIGAALNRRITVTAVGDKVAASVRERAPAYSADASGAQALDDGLSSAELKRLVARLADGFGEHGLTRADVEAAIRWARGARSAHALNDLQGVLKVGPGNVVDDVKRSRARRGRERSARR